MTQPGRTAAEWQALLDEKFPQGALVSPVLKDGTLADVVARLPVLVVMAMRGDWPLLVGIDADGRDIQLHTASWEEIDRNGHYVARTQMAPVRGARRGTFEVSSWLSPALAAVLMEVRESQRDWLLQVSESAAREISLEVEADSEDDNPEAADSAPVTEDMALTMRRVEG